MRDVSSGLITIAADFAARGQVDDALVRAASAAQVGLVTIDDDGRVWWSDDTYFLHGRPRWRRVRTVDDLAWGVRDSAAVRRAYITTLDQDDVELRYTAVGAAGETRHLVLLALGRGVAVVHRAGVGRATTTDNAPSATRPTETGVDVARQVVPLPVVERPVVERPVVERPVVERPVVEHGVVEHRVVEQPPATEATEPEPVASPTVREEAPAPTDADDAVEQWQLAAAALSAMPDLVLLFDVTTSQVVSMAGSAEDAAELVEHLREGHDMREHLHPDDLPRLVEWRAAFPDLVEGEVRSADARFRVGDEWRWRELRASEFRRDDSGTVADVVVVVRDVHDRVMSTHRIVESERAFREVFDASPVGLAVLDDSGRFTDVNDAFCRLAGRTREAVLSTVYEALLHPQDRAAAVITRARRMTEGTKSSSGDARIVRADGTTVWVRVRSTDIEHEGTARTLVSIEDVTHAKATEDQLRHDALHDELTGLPNRRLLLDRLERALVRSRRSGSRLAVYFIDLDDLKRVNDTHPWKHRAGDVLISSSASAVRDALRDADTLGRLGGDEFVAICEDMGDDAVVDEVGERLLVAATQVLTIGSETVRPGASIGVALSESDDEDAESLLRRADAAMYRAKNAGGSRVVRATNDGRTAQPPLDLVGAIARRELVQHYRPIVSLSSGTVLGVTTVVRRRDHDEPLAARVEVGEAPARALPVVQWSIAQAIDDVRTVAPTRVEHVSVWIPTSARATLSDATRSAVIASLRGSDGSEGGDSAPSVVLDIPESELGMLTRRNVVQQHLEDLLGTGPLAVGVAHFTADSVPLGVLQQVSAASVSLDPALLAEAAHHDATAEVVHALVAAASALGVVTIAMDVDSHEQLETARALGVHAVYGDLVGPPAPLDTYSDLLHGGRITLPAPLLADDADADTPDAPLRAGTEPDEVDEWARTMAARLQEPLAERGPLVEPSAEPRLEVDAAPVVEAEPVLEVVADASPEVVVDAVAVETVEVEAVAGPAPEAVAPSLPPLPEVPAWLPAPEAPLPVLPPPGDIGENLARELGFSLGPDPSVPATPSDRSTWPAPSADQADTPHWHALQSQLGAPAAASGPAADESDSPEWAALMREFGRDQP